VRSARQRPPEAQLLRDEAQTERPETMPHTKYTPPAESRFDELKRYVRFDADDARALSELLPHARPHFVRIAREFYERIREHEEAHAVFSGEAQIERLQRSMVTWMERILSGVYDEAYYEETRKIGRVHVRVGLPQRYMFTAMALMRVSLEVVAQDTLGENAASVRFAISRILDLELAVMVESYRDDLAAQAKRRDELETEVLRVDLARALHLYEVAIDAVPNLVVGIDVDGKIRLFNRAARMTTGHALEDVYGRLFIDTLVPIEARPNDAPLLESLLAGVPTDVVEDGLLLTRAGKVRDVRWSFSRIPDGSPHEVVLFAIGEDVTESRAVSQQLHQNEKLAALGTLAAGLAHEIRNPLNGAQLHVSFLRRALEKKLPEPDMLDAAAVVADEIKRLARLVSEFLDFARPSALVKKRVSVQSLFTRVLELTAADATTAGVTVEVDVPPQELVVYADGGKVQQVLLNIVQNAIEALESAHTGRVILRARRHPRHVRIEVEDDGPGLPSPEAPVFDAFFSTKATGTGLGLAITHRIVSDHGGTMDVDSRPGRTSFGFTIPIGNDSASFDGETS
jgi:PAS domain S-box-containing protein